MKYYRVARALFMGNKGREWVMNAAVKISVWCDSDRQITAEETLKYESCKDLVSTGLENQLLLPLVI
jgi:phage terminase Nu1 subunit (DNA packaging protein)